MTMVRVIAGSAEVTLIICVPTPLMLSVVVVTAATLSVAEAALRHENFDREPPNWEGVNNRSTAFEPKAVVQDFGYSAATSHAGGKAGEVGGRVDAGFDARLLKRRCADGWRSRRAGRP